MTSHLPNFCRDLFAYAMPRPTWAWTRTASIAMFGRIFAGFPLAGKESPSIVLTWTAGRMTIRAATGVPRLNLKGASHGKPKNARSPKT
jgi:hypothetical protein